MLWLLTLGLMFACAALYQRVKLAEQRLEDLENSHMDMTARFLALSPAKKSETALEPRESEEQPEVADRTDTEEPGVRLVSALDAPQGEAVSAGPEDIAPPPETAAVPEEVEAAEDRPARTLDFEEIFGRRLPIWAGGITLAVAGVFLVRYSIEAGLLTPSVRVILAFLFGIGLLGGAEAAYRFEDRVGDDRVRQALSGAGLATLYAGFYLAGTQYGLIGQSFAFLGLASVTALAIFVSFRFGLPSAILGLIGGFMAPLLVGGEDANLPVLALYLALVTGGLTQTGNRQGRPWLGLAALVGGLGWGFLLLMDGDLGTADVAAIGLYALVLGAILPTMLASNLYENPARLISAGVASIQLAILVQSAGFQPLSWGLYVLLGAALAFFAWNRPEMRVANVMAGIIAVALLALWPDFGAIEFGLVAAALTVLFAGVPLYHLVKDRSSLVDLALAAGIPLAVGIVTLAQFGSLDFDAVRVTEALACLILAAFPLYTARLLWNEDRPLETVAALASGAALTFFAALCLLPDWATPLAASAITLALIAVMQDRMDKGRAFSALVVIASVFVALTLVPSDGGFAEVERLFTGDGTPDILAALRWLAGFAPFAALTLVAGRSNAQRGAEFVAGLLGFATLAQLLPPIALVWVAALGIVALRLRLPERQMAMLALTICIALWALTPLGEWLQGGGEALAGSPMMLSDLPSLHDTFGFLLPLALGAVMMEVSVPGERRLAFWPAALPIGLVVLHVVFKQLFAIDSMTDFRDLGLGERTLWQALLLAAAWAFAKGIAGREGNRIAAAGLAGLAVLHLFWFGLLLHNPLFDIQAVGPAPLANLALLSGAVGIAALLSLRRWLPDYRIAIDGFAMALATLTAITLLRQVFAGSILPELPMSQSEDLLRSLVGIVMAIAFLLIGSRLGERTWRVGSLVLMTATVIKVFIFDTAGLEGLIRVASFVALGASLIGIGWFYSRQLKAEPSPQ
ncbi:DUF2339 domain-containing protein [Qipengyuania aquimaris]|uniref:DUF2339 domain-containing protein n=1 Tax=Qipengyuania aquimaris TaxID=255984 RepID=UPI001FD32554|nr:DUF2339 domain-containing protein [Qipengyuania aquimaris]UOR16627.1 DUF2339 domain-containing protein [Qipengyuania aquimaris]